MNKCYTLIAFFANEDYEERRECWVANYANREDALKAFRFKLKECEEELDGGKITQTDGSKWTVAKLFDDMLERGYGIDTPDTTKWFVRCQPMQKKFSAKIASWN